VPRHGVRGSYCDVSSNAVQIVGNVVFDVGDQPFYWNVQPGGQFPLVRAAAPFYVANNLFVKSAFNLPAVAPFVNHSAVIDWKGYTPATFTNNVVAVQLPPSFPLETPRFIGGMSCGAGECPPY
jgi:hypothetical protein